MSKWKVIEKRYDTKEPINFGPFDDFLTAVSFVAECVDMFKSVGTEMNEFEYVNRANQVFRGNEAIDTLVKEFPQILDYMWMLPANYKVAGLKVAYAVGSAVRKVVTKGCNCGKK